MQHKGNLTMLVADVLAPFVDGKRTVRVHATWGRREAQATLGERESGDGGELYLDDAFTAVRVSGSCKHR